MQQRQLSLDDILDDIQQQKQQQLEQAVQLTAARWATLQQEQETDQDEIQDPDPNAPSIEDQEQDTEEEEHNSRAWQLPKLIRPYQGLSGAAGHLRRTGRGMTTLPPGLGKTEAAIMACLDPNSTPPYTRPQYGPVLVVCPSFLKELWFDRILDYLPEASVVMCSGTRQNIEKALRHKADWYIINYEMLVPRPAKDLTKLARDPKHPLHKYLNDDGVLDEYLLAVLVEDDPKQYKQITKLNPFPLPRCGTVIFDESHTLANHEATVSQEAASLTKDPSIQVFMLTGTPIRRDPDDLYQQMHILYPHPNYGRTPNTAPLSFSVYEDFKKQYCVNVPTPYGNKVLGRRSARIQQLMDAASYYCSYEDAGIYLPQVQHTSIRFALDPKNADAYKQVSQHYAYQDMKFYSAMEVMHALRACTFCPAKLEQALNLGEQYDKILFFTWYIETAQRTAEALTKRLGRTIPCVSSAIPQDERLQIVDSKPPILVATLGTLSQGKDLSYMQAVCFVEGDWTPYKMEQARDRVIRSGNLQPKIRSYYLLAKDTIDETIHAVSRKRGATADAIVKKVLNQYRATTTTGAA